MKVFLLLILLFVSCFGINLRGQNKDITEIYLKEEMNRKEFLITPGQTYKLINSNDAFIYFIEIQNNEEIIDDENKTIKDITPLSALNSYMVISLKNDTLDEKKVYVTSILNNIDICTYDAKHGHFNYMFERNGIIVIYIDQNEEQILVPDSLENSISYYYYKYDYNSINPRDFSVNNKSLFIKYDGKIITLDKRSIYIIFAEIYKLDYWISDLDLFILPKQVNDNILEIFDSLYLRQSNSFYNISLVYSSFKKILKLSKKTNDSVVIDINDNIILNGNSPYYELTEDNITNGIQIKVLNNDCFIEILLSSRDKSEILDDYSKDNYKLTRTYTIIKIPKIKSKYKFTFSSKNENNLTLFNFGINNKISKNSYFYNFIFNLHLNVNNKGFQQSFYIPDYNNLEIGDEENQIFEIYLDDEQLNNDIYITYNPNRIYNDLLKPIEEQKSEYIIGNISSILDKFYIYKDIAKKPPQFKNFENYHHKPIDLITAINNIPKNNQTYLSLYQDIHRVLNSVRDGHLNIRLKTLENNIDISKFGFCIPFKFYIEQDKNGNPILKIKLNNHCATGINKKLIDNFIKAHYDIPIKSINKTEPFEYIQNFGKYQRYKSRHAQFSYNLGCFHQFYIDTIPYDYSDLTNIEYEFENGDTFSYDYILGSYSSFTDIDQKEFDEFYQSLINNQPNVHLIPNIFDAKRLFMKKKGILLEENNINNIVWDFETSDGKLKCRVDKENKYNVFLQTSFSFESKYNAMEVMINCSELFYSNDYKIIGIENHNNGGTALLYQFWHQLLQQKTLDKTYQSLIYNEKAFEYMKKINYHQLMVNIETCKFIGSFKELGYKNDDYGYSSKFEKNILHNRTNIYEFLERYLRKELEKLRKKNLDNKKFLKRPTDILIFTDSLCYSSGSGLIKAFQNTGGAIIVGFNGNPKLGINEFDGSQSPSSVNGFKDKEYYNLQSLGYEIIGITYAESFDDSYQNPNPIPREYTIDLVDERVPIYSAYSDDLYNDFISEAKEIFEKYETKCSKNNPRLLLDDENCNFNDNRKGGHPCGDDEKWDMSKCEAYYCELGYYYDQFKKQCVLDICTNGNETDIYLGEEIFNNTKQYELNPDEEIVFHLQDDNHFYFFETDINNDNLFSSYDIEDLNLYNRSNFYMFTFQKKEYFDFQVNANYFKTIKEKSKIKITTIKKNPNTYLLNSFKSDKILSDGYIQHNIKENLIYTFDPQKEHILYTFTFNKDYNIYYSIYNSDIEPLDIINTNKNKFNIFSNKLIEIKKNDIGILIYQTTHNYSYVTIFTNPKDIEKDIIIKSQRFIYLNKKNFDYNLNLDSVSKNIYIKLNIETLNAQIEILDGKDSILNKNNRYYLIDKNIKNLSLKLKNDNSALIELLYEYEINNDNNLDINQKNYELEKGLYALKYKKSDKIKSIIIDIESKNKLSGYIFPTIGKGNYSSVFPYDLNFENNYTTTEFIFPEDKIDNNEEFIIFIKFNSTFSLKVKTNKEKNDNNEDNINDDKFPIWAIILIIVIIGIIIILGIIIIIVKKYKGKDINIDINEKDALLEENN